MTGLKITRRGMIGGTAAAAAFVASSFKAAHAHSTPKTFVLVHGALLGGWVWGGVSDILEQQGHKVYSPTLTGLGERSHLMSENIDLDTHIRDIANVIKWEGLNDVCLVAHSYAGVPCSGALEQIGDSVSSIVWLDAFKPESGQKMSDFTSEGIRNLLTNSAAEGKIGFGPPPKLPPVFVSDKDAVYVHSKATPQPIGTYTQPIELSGAREKVAKKTYIRTPRYPHAALDKAMAECTADQSWNTSELADTGHIAMIDAPKQVAKLLMEAT